MFNYSKLIGRIIERYGSRRAFAKAMNVSERTLSLKLNDIVSFKSREIYQICQLLCIDISEIPAYFFTTKVQCLNSLGVGKR